MGFMMIWLLIGVFGVIVGVAIAGNLLGRREIGASHSPQTDRLLAEQAERISQLEDELQRLREQADFTERLLSERHGKDSDEALPPPPGPEDPSAG